MSKSNDSYLICAHRLNRSNRLIMKLNLFALLALYCLGSTHANAEEDAGARKLWLNCIGLPDGVYPNPLDCTTFYMCSNSITYLMHCPDDLLFDEPTVRCQWPELARCPGGDCDAHKGGELHGAEGCHGHKVGETYPDPYDCGSFYRCTASASATSAGGQAQHERCEAGLHFNNDTMRCDGPERAGCKSCGPDPTDPPPTTTTTEAPTTTIQEPSTAAPTTTVRPTTARPTTTVRPTTGRPTTTARPTTTRRTTTRRPPGGGSSSEESSESNSASSSEEN